MKGLRSLFSKQVFLNCAHACDPDLCILSDSFGIRDFFFKVIVQNESNMSISTV